MRLAILSDIHGNPLALDAVLADIQRQGEVDAYWVMGDFAAAGPAGLRTGSVNTRTRHIPIIAASRCQDTAGQAARPPC